MKRFLLVVSFFLVMTAGPAWAEPSIHLSHTLTGYTEGVDSVTLDYVLHVENQGADPLYNLTLSNAPLLLISQDEFFLDVGTLGAYGTLDIPFSFVIPMLLSQDEISELPLFWIGEGQDANSNIVEFPAESNSTTGGGV